MASDHAGVDLKLEIIDLLKSMGHEVEDMGPYTKEAADLSDYVYPANVAFLLMEWATVVP
jgi:ribose 5-phosphate isomerase B